MRGIRAEYPSGSCAVLPIMYSLCMGTTNTAARLAAMALALGLAFAAIGSLPRLPQPTTTTTITRTI